MSVFGLPLDLPVKVVDRALSDLSAIAKLAAEMPERLDALDRRAEQLLDLGERVVALGESIDGSAREIVELGERMHALGLSINDQGVVIADRAQDVADRAGEIITTLPVIERAVGMATPLEGAVERLGRMVDRMPGGTRQKSGEQLGPPD